MLLVLVSARAGSLTEYSENNYTSQTVMVYIVGADLESQSGAATRDIAEMLKARFDTEMIRVLAMTGGATKWHSPIISTDELSVFEISGNQPKKVHSLPLQSMGNKATLTSFLNFAVSEYPSDSYGLILWDHGGGPMIGYGVDERHKGDSLTLPELREALDDSVFGDGNKLEWIGFDACLMSSAEVAFMVSDYARYMIASQETLPGQGWNYAFLKDLGDTSLRGPDVARLIIDRTFEYYDAQMLKRPDWKPALTLSCLSLEHAAALESTLDALFAEMDDALASGSYSILAQNRDSVKAYGLSTTSQDYDLIDIGDLAVQMEFLYPEKCAALAESVSRMAMINRSNQPFSNGISLYYPFRNKNYYEKQWKEEYPVFKFAPEYTSFMQHFGDILLSDSITDWSSSRALQPFYNEERQAYSLQLTPEQAAHFDKAYYYLLIRYEGEEYFMHFKSSDVTLDEQLRLTANFDGNAVMIRSPGSDVVAMPVVMEREVSLDTGFYQSNVRLLRGSNLNESATGALQIEVNKKAGAAQITGLILDGQNQGIMTGKNDSNLQDWDLIEIWGAGRYLTRDKSGNVLPFSMWEKSGGGRGWDYWIKNGVEAFYGPVDVIGEDVFCVIEIVDTQGNRYNSELMPVASEKPAAVESVPPISDWEPEVIAFSSGITPVQTLVNQDGLIIEFMDLGFDRFNNDLQMSLKIKNETSSDLKVEVIRLVINNMSLYSVPFGYVSVAANSEDEYIVDIRSVTELQKLSVNHVNNVDFVFEVKTSDYATLFKSAWFSLQPDLALPERIGVATVPIDHGVVFSEDGAVLEITGAYQNEFSLSVEYILRNNGDVWDVLGFEDISVNDVNGFKPNRKYVRPGTDARGSIWILPDADEAAEALEHPEILSFFIVLTRTASSDGTPFRKYGPVLIDLGASRTNRPENEPTGTMDIQPPHVKDFAGAMSPLDLLAPIIVDAVEDRPRDHAIVKTDDISLVLTDVGFDGKGEELLMGLKVGNAAASPVTIELTNVVVNDTSLYLYINDVPEIAAGSETELTQWLANGVYLRELGIEEVQTIDFLLHVKTPGQEDLLEPVPVSIRWRFAVPVPFASDEGVLPVMQGVVLDQEGLILEITGAYQDENYLYLQYLLHNSSNDWDWCSFENLAVNGQGGFSGVGVDKYVRPGTKAQGDISITKEDLAKNGIITPARIEFHIALTRLGLSHSKFMKRIGPVQVQLLDREGYRQPMDTEGKVIVDNEGFTLIQLDRDPTGKSFFCNNQTPWAVRLQVSNAFSLGHGIDYAYFSGYSYPPGQSFYVHLDISRNKSYQSPVAPSTTLDVRLLVINKDKSSLMYLTDPITFIP